MADLNPPIRTSAYSFPAFLVSQADSTTFVSNATVLATDMFVSKDFGSWASITNVPSVSPAAGKQLMVSLTTTEMDADTIAVLFADAAGAQWFDREYIIQTARASWSTFASSTDSVGLKAVTHSGATVRGVENYSNLSGTLSNLTVRLGAYDYSSLVTVGAGIAAPSLVTVQVSGGTIAGVTNKVDLRAGTYSDISLRLDVTSIPAGAFQADSIDAVAFAAMNLSDVTVRVQPMAYSGLTVGINNAAGNFSAATVQVSGGTVTGVTNIVQSNLTTIFGNREAVIRLLSHLSSVVTGVAVAGTLSTTTMTSDVAEATDDHFNDRVIVFLTGALAGQATSITSFFGSSAGSSRFNFPALTEAPTANDEFMVV